MCRWARLNRWVVVCHSLSSDENERRIETFMSKVEFEHTNFGLHARKTYALICMVTEADIHIFIPKSDVVIIPLTPLVGIRENTVLWKCGPQC